MKKKKIIIIISIIILTLLVGLILLLTKENHLIKLNYNEIIEKVNNKESFVLCVSASECIHCQEYKPKLKKISEKYDVTLYYVNIDEFSDKEYNTFKSTFSFDGGTPTTIFFKEGEEKTTATRIEGNVKAETIINKLKNNGFIKE